jgi:hypothetical protein
MFEIFEELKCVNGKNLRILSLVKSSTQLIFSYFVQSYFSFLVVYSNFLFPGGDLSRKAEKSCESLYNLQLSLHVFLLGALIVLV